MVNTWILYFSLFVSLWRHKRGQKRGQGPGSLASFFRSGLNYLSTKFHAFITICNIFTLVTLTSMRKWRIKYITFFTHTTNNCILSKILFIWYRITSVIRPWPCIRYKAFWRFKKSTWAWFIRPWMALYPL